jgi:hypothetical protein
MMTEVVECEEGALRAGMGLEVTFRGVGAGAGEDAADVVVPVFRPRV